MEEDNPTYHLIQEESFSSEEKSWSQKHPKQRNISYSLHLILLICLYIGVVFAGALTVVILDQIPHSTKEKPHIYTPVEDLIQYVPTEQANSLHDHNPFMANPNTGLPDISADEQWEMLYNESMHTSIPSSLAAKLPLKTLPVPSNPSEYLIQLEVYHQLHCLNTLRQALYLDSVPRYRTHHFADFYLENGRRDFRGRGGKHLDHCLDWIRQSLLCSGDTTPVSWAWDSLSHVPLPQLPHTKICKDMLVIDNWTREHKVKEPVDFGFGEDADL